MLAQLLQFQLLLRLYHWKTVSYARHTASGALYEKLDGLIDQFVETAQGVSRGQRLAYKPFRLDGHVMDDRKMDRTLVEFAAFLEQLKLSHTDLQNLRDEMLAEVDKTKYLFTLK